MDTEKFGRPCPVCAGPLVSGEGGFGCVLCGYALRQVSIPRIRVVKGRQVLRGRRARQLMLPLAAS
jgi:uncharacterized Zn finger protein (UPF0148 family)